MWWTNPPWSSVYSAEIMNRTWLTWKQSMRKQISSSEISTGKRSCVGVCAQRRSPERRGWNIWLWINAQLTCLHYGNNTNIPIRHVCYNCRRKQKKSRYKCRTWLTAWEKAILASDAKMTKCNAKSGRCGRKRWGEESTATRGRAALISLRISLLHTADG